MHLKQPASPASCLLFVAPLPAFSGVVLPWLVSLVFSPADVFLLPSHRALFFACKHSQSSLPSIDNIIILLLSSSCMCSFSVLDSLTLPPQCLLVSLSLLSHSLRLTSMSFLRLSFLPFGLSSVFPSYLFFFLFLVSNLSTGSNLIPTTHSSFLLNFPVSLLLF